MKHKGEILPYYAVKFVTKDGKGPSYSYQYDLPKDGAPSKWHNLSKRKKRIECCSFGYHASLYSGIMDWYSSYYTEGNRCFIVEIAGKLDIDFCDNKICSEKMRFVVEIPTKPVKEINGRWYVYQKENLTIIKKFIKDGNYTMIDEFYGSLPETKSGHKVISLDE